MTAAPTLSALLLAIAVMESVPEPTALALQALQTDVKLPRTPARCKPVETAAIAALAAESVTGDRLSPCVIRIMGSGTHPLAVLAHKLESAQVKLLFDAGYLVENPYAAANFNAEQGALRVPVTLFSELSVDDPILQHELVHVAIWAAARKDETNMVAYLHGEPYQPNDLALDEMRAYADDLSRAASALKGACKKASSQSWTRIWEQRKKDLPSQSGLSGCELLFDRVAAKVAFGRNHTEPAIGALESLASVSIPVEVTGDRNETILRGVTNLGGKAVPIELHLVRLAPKRNADTGATLNALLKQARSYLAFWQKAAETLDKLSQAQPRELSSLLDTLVKRSKAPLATPPL